MIGAATGEMLTPITMATMFSHRLNMGFMYLELALAIGCTVAFVALVRLGSRKLEQARRLSATSQAMELSGLSRLIPLGDQMTNSLCSCTAVSDDADEASDA